jgi:hypothetical protein
LSFDGYDDWFLPSKDELDLMYKNLKQKGLGDFGGSSYWSSSQSNYDYRPWSQRFSDGSQDGNLYSRTNPFLVRAVRAF